MRVIYDLESLEKSDVYGVVTLGNFDGIHRGHRSIIQRCIDEAEKIQGRSIVVSYDHQNSAVFHHHREFITTTGEKIEILENLGVDTLILIPFSEKIKNMTADDFLSDLLVKKLNARVIVIGYDHHFGKNREGDIDYLRNRSREFQYEVIQMEPVYYLDRIISSSRIRSDLVMGQLNKVSDQLGYDYMILGKVVAGYNRGMAIGFPTANISVSEKKLLPLDGVFAGKAQIEINGQKTVKNCVVNIGKNPTFQNKKISVEVHLLDLSPDFSPNLYDQQIRVSLLVRLRDEKKFENVEALKNQIRNDIEKAQTIFGAGI